MIYRVIKLRFQFMYFLIVLLTAFFFLGFLNTGIIFLQVFGGAFMLFALVALGYIMLLGDFSHKVIIGVNGVSYTKRNKKHTLLWDDIKQIGVGPDKIGRYTNNCFIYFLGGNHDKAISFISVREYNEEIFGVQYRDKIITDIKQYWDKPIYNIERL